MRRRDDDIFKKLSGEKPLAKSASGSGHKMPEKSTFDILLEKQSTERKKPTTQKSAGRKAPQKSAKQPENELDVFSEKSKSSTRAKDAKHDIDYGSKPAKKEKPQEQPQVGAETKKRTAAPKETPKKRRSPHDDALKIAEMSAALDYNEDKLERAMKGLEIGAEQTGKRAEVPKKAEAPKRAAASRERSAVQPKKAQPKQKAQVKTQPGAKKTPQPAKTLKQPQMKKETSAASTQSIKPADSSVSRASMARSVKGAERGVKKVLRHEHKYYINYKDHIVLQTALSSIMRLDENADEYGGYHIRSLYFDDVYETALAEKINGTDNRKKYRIRIYNYSDGDIKLEKKQKHGKFIRKTSMNLTRAECDSLIAGDPNFLLEKDNKLATEFYLNMRSRLLRPRVIVDYWREAYVYPIEDVRITFDIDLKGSTMLTDIFDPNTPVLPVFDNGIMVLEVKFNKYLPEAIKCALHSVGAVKRSAISKYVLCRKYD